MPRISARQHPVRPRQKCLPAFGSTANAVLIVDAAQRVIYWNKGAEKLLGYPAAEVLNQHCYEVLAGRCCAKLWCYAGCKVLKWVQRCILPDDFDLLTHTKEGKDIWVNVSTIVLPRRNKFQIVHLLRNVTQQKRNEEAIQNLLGALGVSGSPQQNTNGKNGAGRNLICQENKLSALTRREIEVLSLSAEGVSTGTIAQRIGVSPFTVRNHVRNALKKLGLHSKAEAVSFAFMNGLL